MAANIRCMGSEKLFDVIAVVGFGMKSRQLAGMQNVRRRIDAADRQARFDPPAGENRFAVRGGGPGSGDEVAFFG